MKNILALALTLMACSAEENVVRVCVNYYDDDTRKCGTGFWLSEDSMRTAWHVVSDAENDTVTIAYGIEEPSATEQIITKIGYDIASIDFDESVSESVWDLCKNKDALRVEMIGALHDGIETILANVIDFDGEYYTIDKPVVHGYSGGPLIDVDNDCVLGVITMRSGNNTKCEAL